MGTGLYKDRYRKDDGVWRIEYGECERIYEVTEILERVPHFTAHFLGKHGKQLPAAARYDGVRRFLASRRKSECSFLGRSSNFRASAQMKPIAGHTCAVRAGRRGSCARAAAVGEAVFWQADALNSAGPVGIRPR